MTSPQHSKGRPTTPAGHIKALCVAPTAARAALCIVDMPEPRALLQRTFLGHHPVQMMHSPHVSPASHRVLPTPCPTPTCPPGTAPSPTSLAHPVIASPHGLGLFSGLPPVCDGERLAWEVVRLIVSVCTIRVRDAPHDALRMDETWGNVGRWVREVAES